MICDKCGAKVQSAIICPICGNGDIVQYSLAESEVEQGPHKISNRLKAYSVFVFVGNAISLILILLLISAATSYPTNEFLSPNVLLAIYYLGIGLIILEVILMVFILKLKKWALNTFLAFRIISLLLNLLQGQFFAVLLNAALLAFVFKKDYDYFT